VESVAAADNTRRRDSNPVTMVSPCVEILVAGRLGNALSMGKRTPWRRGFGARTLRKIDEVNFVAERANPESRTVRGAGFRVCAQEGASRNDEDGRVKPGNGELS
jgi:hypothetical protein